LACKDKKNGPDEPKISNTANKQKSSIFGTNSVQWERKSLEENPVLCGEALPRKKAAGFAESQCTLVWSILSGNATSAEDTLAENFPEDSEELALKCWREIAHQF